MNSQQILLKDRLIKRATEEYSKYPQYQNHFNNWVLVKFTRGIKFKSGAVFRTGDYTIADLKVVDIQDLPYYQVLTQLPANDEMKDLLTTGIGPVPARGGFLDFVQ